MIYLIVPRKYPTLGKPLTWIRLGTTLEEAHRTFANLLAGERAGTMEQLLDRYEKDVLPTKGKKTAKEQGRQLERIRKWCGKIPLGGLTRTMVQRYVDERPPVAGNRELSLLSHIFKKGIRWVLLNETPCSNVERHREKPTREGVDFASMIMAWRAAKPWMRALMALGYVIGQRRGDVRFLKESDFSYRGLQLTQSKTGSTLLMEWTPNLKAAHAYALEVRKVSSIERWVVSTNQGKPVSESSFKREWKRIQALVVKDGGKRFMFKSIRAQSATDHETGAHLGHKDPRVLKKHYRLGPTKVRPI